MSSQPPITTNVSDLFRHNEDTKAQLLASGVQTITAVYTRQYDDVREATDLRALDAHDVQVAIDPNHLALVAARLSSLPIGLANEGIYRLHVPTMTLTNTVTASTKDDILAQCRAWGLKTVTAEYNGSGDDGCIEEVKADRELTAEERTSLEDFAWDVIESQHPGFEINDGGCGNVIIDVDAGSIQLQHYTNVMESLYEETDL